MNERDRVRTSKFLSLVLRHRPEAVGIQLDDGGWVDVEVLLHQCAENGKTISRAALEEIVATSPKQRFAFSEDGSRIRANQGHSIDVELGYQPSEPPEHLYHGTVATCLASIREQGLDKMQRHHVHLSSDRQTASEVGKRRGRSVLLTVRAGEMSAAGHEFFVSVNGVWLTAHVPAAFIDFPD